MKFPIDKGIPVPRGPAGMKPELELPLAEMEVGDSFLIPFTTRARASLIQVVYRTKKRFLLDFPERDFTFRTLNKGLRVWRTK